MNGIMSANAIVLIYLFYIFVSFQLSDWAKYAALAQERSESSKKPVLI